MESIYDDLMAVENGTDSADDFDYFAALQRQINSGLIWSMQGSMGRAAMDAIEAGRCMCGTESHRDYWGNIVPSRTDVQDGTKGSKSFVAEHSGQPWADAMAAL